MASQSEAAEILLDAGTGIRDTPDEKRDLP